VELNDLNNLTNHKASDNHKVGPHEEEWIKEEPLMSID